MPEAAASRKRADLGPANSRSFSDDRTPYLGPKRIRAAESQSWPWAACASRTRDSGNARFPDFIDIMLVRHFDGRAVLDARARESLRGVSRKCDWTAFRALLTRAGAVLLVFARTRGKRFDPGI